MQSSVNINDEVWVCLTLAGLEVFRADIEKFPLPEGTTIDQVVEMRDDGGGWSKFQLYELMYIFGPKLYNGAPEQMFEVNTVFFTKPH